MYQFSYSEIIAGSSADARFQERRALERAIELLGLAAAADPAGDAAERALSFTTQLWGAFIHDLSHPGNDLEAGVRAGLISIGLWVMAEAQAIQNGASRNYEGIAEICAIVRDGLQ